MEDKFWLKLWAMVLAGVVVVILSAMLYDYKIESQAFEAGYQQEMVPGNAYSVWRKIR